MSTPIVITFPNEYLSLEQVDGKVGIVDTRPTVSSRKRRLDNLTWEEKMQRKKLKNRVAAQTSRDRKKAKMDEMEDRIQILEDKNERLMSEVASLRALNERLISENTSLRRAAQEVAVGSQGPAEGGILDGLPRGASTGSDVPALAELLAHLDSDEYFDTLQDLANSLIQEIDANHSGSPAEVPFSDTRQQAEETMVGSTAEQLESSKTGIIDSKHDINRILMLHSYAHPFTDSCSAENTQNVLQQPNQTNPKTNLKPEISKVSEGDKGDLFYASCDEDNDCITIEVPCEDQSTEELKDNLEISSIIESSTGIGFGDMKLLSPMSLTPQPDENLLAVSPAHTFSSDLGYESLSSPLSEPDPMDLSDFWCESLSELFPGLV